MTQRYDLRVLGRIAPAQQDQPAKDPDHKQVQQTNRHEAQSCPIPLILPNRRSQAVYRVVNRYTPPPAIGRGTGHLQSAAALLGRPDGPARQSATERERSSRLPDRGPAREETCGNLPTIQRAPMASVIRARASPS
jgi:hypothetical protein